MELSLILLRLTGMFPRVLKRDWELSDGRRCSRFGKFFFFSLLVLSVMPVLLRFVRLVMSISGKDTLVYATGTMFDLMGSKIWNCNYVACELLTVTSVLLSSKRIRHFYDKIFILLHLYGVSSEEIKKKLSGNSFLSPWVGVCFCSMGIIFTSHQASVMHFLLAVQLEITALVFVSLCCSSVHCLAVLQLRVHSLDQTVLSRLQTQSLPDPNHFPKLLLSRKSVEQARLQFFFFKKIINSSLQNRNPKLLIHLRLQEVIVSIF